MESRTCYADLSSLKSFADLKLSFSSWEREWREDTLTNGDFIYKYKFLIKG